MAIINGVGRVGIRNYVSPTNPLWDNLTHYYSADNNANDSKGTAHGILMNGTAYSSAKINNGFNMDGVNDFVQLPDDTFKFLGDFSISFWIYKKSNNTPLYLAALKAGDAWYGGFYMYNSGGGIATVINGWDVTTSSIIPSNQWTHVVFTHKQSTINRFYVNGVLNNTSSGVRNSTVNPDHSTGVILSTIGYAWSPDAIMDEVATFNTELTASQVSELYNSGAGKQYIATTPTYTARTTALISATGITDTTLINAINTLDLGIISNNLPFTSNDAMYLSVLGSSNACSYNFIDTTKYRLTFNGGFTFTGGIVGNGTNGYATTGWIPSNIITGGKDYGALGVYLGADFVNDKHPMGAHGASLNTYFGVYPNASTIGININDSGNGNLTPLTKRGFFQGSRSSSTTTLASDNTHQATINYPSYVLPTTDVWLSSLNFYNTRYGSTNVPIRFAYLSENRFTHAQQLTMNTLVATFLTTLGLNV